MGAVLVRALRVGAGGCCDVTDCCCRWRACGSSRSTAALVLCRKKVD
jgi:hypothetical protein